MRQLGAHFAGHHARIADGLKEGLDMLGRITKSWRMIGGRAEIEQQVEEELRFHCEMLTEDYREAGMSEDAARKAASKRFGDRERVQAECVEISRRNRPAM